MTANETTRRCGCTIIFRGLLAVALLVAAQTTQVQAQTGTRIGQGTFPVSTIYLQKPALFDRLPRLINDGRTEEALAAAKAFTRHLDANRMSPYFYDGYNALCVAETASKSLGEAMTACDTAIRSDSRRWQALNNRGTIHYLRGDYSLAVADYKMAESAAHGDGNAALIIAHNLALVSAKQ